jgi:hypothetical protein
MVDLSCQGDNYEEYSRVRFDAVWTDRSLPTFWRNISTFKVNE